MTESVLRITTGEMKFKGNVWKPKYTLKHIYYYIIVQPQYNGKL